MDKERNSYKLTKRGKQVRAGLLVTTATATVFGLNSVADAISEHNDRAESFTLIEEEQAHIETGQGGVEAVHRVLGSLAEKASVDPNIFNPVEIGQEVHTELQEKYGSDFVPAGASIDVRIVQDGNGNYHLEADPSSEE